MHTSAVRLAERSKAPDLSSGTRKCAWVRTPHLTTAEKLFPGLTRTVPIGQYDTTVVTHIRFYMALVKFHVAEYISSSTTVSDRPCNSEMLSDFLISSMNFDMI